jgi:PKD repeat protein
VPNAAPVARLTLTPQVVVAGAAITGSSAGSADREDVAATLTFDWDWNGDGVYEAQGATTNHTYPAAGQYPVVLRVTDSRGAVGFATATALVMASAADIVAVTTGADENDPGATPATPLGAGFSLREAVRWATVTAGPQTIVVPAGTTVLLSSQLNFTDNQGITVAGNGAVLDGSGISGAGSSCLDLAGRYHRLDGLEIRNCPGWPIYTHGQDMVVTRCKVHDNRYGVELAGSNDTFGPDNEVYANGTFGIDVNGLSLVVGNVFRMTQGPAISLRSAADSSSVVGNMAWDNERGVEVAAQCDNVRLWHNTIHASSRDGVLLSNDSSGVDLRNNLVTNSGGFGLNLAAGSLAVIDGNDLFQNVGGACRACSGLGPQALQVDPGYIDAAGRDLRIYRSSAVANAGVDTGADRNGPLPGNFNGSAPDVGAFEAP